MVTRWQRRHKKPSVAKSSENDGNQRAFHDCFSLSENEKEAVATMPKTCMSFFACLLLAVAGCGKADRPAVEFPAHPAMPTHPIPLKSLNSRELKSPAGKPGANPATPQSGQ
jgi:hypothetical protein